MRNGFTQKTLGIAAAALLSGSVFAAGPTLSNMPTVVITDKMNEADVTASASGPYDYFVATSQGIFRFTDAFQPRDYVQFGAGSQVDLETVKYLWREVEDDGSGGYQAATTETIAVNGELGVTTVPAYGDITAASTDDIWNTSGDGYFDFQNIIYSPFPTAVNPSPPAAGTVADEAFIELYVASTDPNTGSAVDMQMFSVLTSNDVAEPWDSIEDATGFAPVACYDDFGGWIFRSQGQFGEYNVVPFIFIEYESATAGATDATLVNLPLDLTLTPIFLGGDYTDPSTTDFALLTDGDPGDGLPVGSGWAPQYTYMESFRRDGLNLPAVDGGPVSDTYFDATEDNIYMVRYTVTRNDSGPIAGVPTWRFRTGEYSAYGAGVLDDTITGTDPSGLLPASPSHFPGNGASSIHRSWYYANADGPVGFYLDAIDLYTTDNGANISLNKIEVFQLTRGDLAGETVLLNNGGEAGTDFTLLAGEDTPPATGLADFDIDPGDATGTWTFENFIERFPAIASERVGTSTGSTPKQLSMNLSSGDGATFLAWDTRNIPTATDSEIIDDVANEKLIVMDVWLSTTTSGAATATMPSYRFGFEASTFGETGVLDLGPPVNIVSQGRTTYMVLESGDADPDSILPGFFPQPSINLQSAARKFTMIMEPQIRAGATIDVRPSVQIIAYDPFYSPDASSPANLQPGPAAGNITINRLVVTTYDRPAAALSSVATCN